MKSLISFIAFAMMSTSVFANERVNYVERVEAECYTDPNGITRCRMVTKAYVSVVKDIKDESGEAAPTPYSEIVRVLGLLPKPVIGFVDYGCGDGRWVIAAAEKWGCRATGVEIDPARAAVARERVHAAGLGKLVTIVEGDATTTDVQADVGVAYLYTDVLAKLRPKIEKLTAFASYLHQPPYINVTRNGDSWFYTRPQMQQVQVRTQQVASWGGRTYTAPSCNNPRCAMCQSIRRQLATPIVETQQTSTPTTSQQTEGHYVKHCNGKTCWYEWVPATPVAESTVTIKVDDPPPTVTTQSSASVVTSSSTVSSSYEAMDVGSGILRTPFARIREWRENRPRLFSGRIIAAFASIRY